MYICMENRMDCVDRVDLTDWLFYYQCAIGGILFILLIAICKAYFQIRSIKKDFNIIKRTPQYDKYKQLVEKGKHIRRKLEQENLNKEFQNEYALTTKQTNVNDDIFASGLITETDKPGYDSPLFRTEDENNMDEHLKL